ncbi:hypothetical protein ABIE33_006828 [Ensifer sp. 4252]
MTQDDDARLMAEINAQANAAEEHRTILANLRAMASRLAANYPHRSADEIEAKAKIVWRARRLHWKE